MILDREVEVVLNGSNIRYFENKGYNIPRYYNQRSGKYAVKKDAKIMIKPSDLSKGSNVVVEAQCEYCNKSKKIKHKDYYKSVKSNEFIKKYCCENCDHLKTKEVYEYKQRKGILKRGDRGYWTFKENRLKELSDYIKKNGNIINMKKNKLGSVILSVLKEHGESLEDSCVELGYDLYDINGGYMPKGYYEDFDNLKNGIAELTEQLSRFPKQKEVLQHLRISNNILLSFGGIREIKDRMGYCDENDLIDDRGFKNASTYEFMVAQYLILNSIPYKREQNPFKGEYSRLRSDFTFYTDNSKEIHVEIWGYSKNDFASKRSVEYNKNRVLKEELYENSNHILIGIEYEVFNGKYSDIQKRLYDIFSPYLNLGLKKVEQDRFIPTNKMTDRELLNEIMKFSGNKNILPRQEILHKNNASHLLSEVLDRYKNYYEFARRFNKKTLRKRHDWSKGKVFEVFNYMIYKYDRVLKTEEIKRCKDRNVRGIIVGSRKTFGSFLEARVSFYEYLIEEKKKIPQSDKDYIEDALNVRRGFNRKYLTEQIMSRLHDVKQKQIK